MIPARRLADLLDALQRLVEPETSDASDQANTRLTPESDPATTSSTSLRLIAIRDTSAAYAISASDPAFIKRTLAEAGDAINAPDRGDWTSGRLQSIKQLSTIASATGSTIEIRQGVSDAPLGPVIAAITPDTYRGIREHAFFEGETSIFARIERVGGARHPSCHVRLPHRPSRQLVCRVAERSLAQRLATHLYDHVYLHGSALWQRRDLEISRFQVNSFEAPKRGSLNEAAKGIRKATFGAWDEIGDPDSYIRELRG